MNRSNLSYLDQVVHGMAKLSAAPLVVAATVMAELLIIILDRSGSMDSPCGHTTRLGAAQDAIMALIDTRAGMGADDEVALIAFNERARLILPFTRSLGHRRDIEQAARSISAHGGTSLEAGFQKAREILQPRRREHLVFLSDGHGGVCVVTETIKRSGAIIETIGVGNDPSDVAEDILKGAASTLNGKVLYRFIRDANELTEYFSTEIANRLVKRSVS